MTNLENLTLNSNKLSGKHAQHVLNILMHCCGGCTGDLCAELITDSGLRLAGPLPASWKDMKSLMYIDISHDNLTGVIAFPQCTLGRRQDL